MRIRDRRPADLDRCVAALAAVHRCDRYPLNWPADPAAWLSPPGLLHAWIAEGDEGTLAGHIALHEAASRATGTNGGTVALSRLFVTPTFRGNALGMRLLTQAQRWATDHGFDLTLDVTDRGGRSAAVALYERAGWQFTHTSQAEWTGPRGEPVRLRHYRYQRPAK